MNFIKIYHTHNTLNYNSVGFNPESNTVCEFFQNEELVKQNTIISDNENFNFWSYLLKELGYKVKFTTSLDLYSDASDFFPEFETPFQLENLQTISVHIVYERDFFPNSSNLIEFIDKPKEFQFSINQLNFNIQSDNFSLIFETIVKSLATVSQFNVNPDIQVEDYNYDY